MSQSDIDSGRMEGSSGDERRKLVGLGRKNRVIETDVEILTRASAHFAFKNVLPQEGSG